jgi:hypothetical protein
MLMEAKNDEDCRDVMAEPVGRFHRNDLVRAMKAEFLFESLRHRNGAEQTLRRRIEIVGHNVLVAVLEIGDGGIFGNRQFRRLEPRKSREG